MGFFGPTLIFFEEEIPYKTKRDLIRRMKPRKGARRIHGALRLPQRPVFFLVIWGYCLASMFLRPLKRLHCLTSIPFGPLSESCCSNGNALGLHCHGANVRCRCFSVALPWLCDTEHMRALL